MVPDPFVGPRDTAAPPIGVRVKHPEVDARQRDVQVEITPVAAIVQRVVRRKVEGAFAAPGHEVVRVQGLDVGAHLVDPGG